MPVTC